MKTRSLLIIFCLILFSSCEFRKSVNKDLITGLTTRGDGLSCEAVFLSDGKELIERNLFTYGEKFSIVFENIEGFEKVDEKVYPGMQMIVTDEAGDTVMNIEDLYNSYTDGIDKSPLELKANLTAADPIMTDKKYNLHINIWDKKGEGTFKAELDFNLVPNSLLIIENKNLEYDNIYLFSDQRKSTIIDNKVGLNEYVYLIFNGLKGFEEADGLVKLGISIKGTDADGRVLIDEADLVGEDPMQVSDISKQLAPNFVFTGTSISSPVTCEINVWDKNTNNNIVVSMILQVE